MLKAIFGKDKTTMIHKAKIELLKEEKRLVYGIVLKPDIPDAHGDVISKEVIEKSAHQFLADYGVIGEQHQDRAKARVVESYIAPHQLMFGDRVVPEGAWVMVVKVFDDWLWNEIKLGKFTAFSTGGMASTVEI